ncbi:MAG: hypothetical protein QNJ97_24245 [Myxococcota bacterium]|nr:hypothetical protein [Myxococcota bacterium]
MSKLALTRSRNWGAVENKKEVQRITIDKGRATGVIGMRRFSAIGTPTNGKWRR